MQAKDFSLGKLQVTLLKGNNGEIIAEYSEKASDASVKNVVDRGEFIKFWSDILNFVRTWDAKDQEDVIKQLYGEDLVARLRSIGVKDLGYLTRPPRYARK